MNNEQGKKDEGVRRLIESGALYPGIIKRECGMIIFEPISNRDYELKLQRTDIEELAYHTYSMRRGLFNFSDSGSILNIKGVDSLADSGDVKTCDISKNLGMDKGRHEIVITYFGHGSYTGHVKSPEIRVKGHRSFNI